MERAETSISKVPVTKETTTMSLRAITLMAFMTVWGFGNVVNGYAYFNGVKSIISWVIVFIIYFIPYSLIVGELGSAFKESGAGVSSWIEKAFNKRLAYYAGWTYWVVHLPYISQKPLGVIIASSWAIYGDKRVLDWNTNYIQIGCIIIFGVVLFLSRYGVKMVKHLCAIAGMFSLVLCYMFILLAVAAPSIRSEVAAQANSIPTDIATYWPNFDFKYLTNFSILIFGVGGCEKISPYVNKMKKPGREFPLSIIFMTIMVIAVAVLGTISLSLMFDATNPPEEMISVGTFIAFQKLGAWYGIGDFFVKVYAISIAVSQFAVMVLSIDAPLRMLIESADDDFIPAKFKTRNSYGSYIYGTRMIAIVVTILLIIPMIGMGSVTEIVKFMIKLNAVCMPLRYCWVFLAYFGLKRLANVHPDYCMTKNKSLGKLLAFWCAFITLASCIWGMYDENLFKMFMNFITPFILLGLGAILPLFAKKSHAKK